MDYCSFLGVLLLWITPAFHVFYPELFPASGCLIILQYFCVQLCVWTTYSFSYRHVFPSVLWAWLNQLGPFLDLILLVKTNLENPLINPSAFGLPDVPILQDPSILCTPPPPASPRVSTVILCCSLWQSLRLHIFSRIKRKIFTFFKFYVKFSPFSRFSWGNSILS